MSNLDGNAQYRQLPEYLQAIVKLLQHCNLMGDNESITTLLSQMREEEFRAIHGVIWSQEFSTNTMPAFEFACQERLLPIGKLGSIGPTGS